MFVALFIDGCSMQVRVTSFAASTAHEIAMAATDDTQSKLATECSQ